MPRSGTQTRSRIVDAAYGLFWRQGFLRVSMDEVAARAKVTKRTLYQHFRSKDDLIADTLSHTSEFALARLVQLAANTPDRPEAIVAALFSELAEWAAKPRWSGTGFTRVAVELADLRGHPARTIARRHKASVEAWLANLLKRARVPLPIVRAREVVLLMEGAVLLMLVHGDRSYAAAAAEAAKVLVTRQRQR
jgi:AcrR family transcriptional regulator